MSIQDISPSERFKKNLLTLFQVVEDMYDEGINNEVIKEDNTKILLPAVKLYISTKKSEIMIERWIQKTHEHWDKIKEKDIEYFQDIGLKIFNIIQDKGLDKVKANADEEDVEITNQISEEQVNGFKKLLEGEYEYEGDKYKIFNEEVQQLIWNIMESFVKISIRYIYETRRIIKGEGTVDCFIDLPLNELSDKWNLKFDS